MFLFDQATSALDQKYYELANELAKTLFGSPTSDEVSYLAAQIRVAVGNLPLVSVSMSDKELAMAAGFRPGRR